jgi:hypothetical protein
MMKATRLGIFGHHGLSLMGALIGAIPFMPRLDMPQLVSRGVHTRQHHMTTYHRTNGDRECARRRRQIAQGRLTEANGLVREVALREAAE